MPKSAADIHGRRRDAQDDRQPPQGRNEHYVGAVLTQAYRRGFRAAAQSLAQAADELPEDQLFEHLLSIGRERRAASQRLAAIREAQP